MIRGAEEEKAGPYEPVVDPFDMELPPEADIEDADGGIVGLR